MTYLATEMLAYLAATAIVGLMIGWLIWGAGRRRKLEALRSDLTAMIEAEREAHQQTRLNLGQVDADVKKAVDEVRAESTQTIAKLRKAIEIERRVAREKDAALAETREKLERAVQLTGSTNQDAIDEAKRAIDAEKVAATVAMAKEAQSRAQIEELRLLIGAEKLAAESARSELAETRADMQAKLDAEREAHQRAKEALDGIRSTLSQTLGTSTAALSAASLSTTAGLREEPVAPPPPIDTLSAANEDMPIQADSPLYRVMDITADGDALNNPDLDEADIEDREDIDLDLSSPIDVEIGSETPDVKEGDRINIAPPPKSTDRIPLPPMPTGTQKLDAQRPWPWIDQAKKPDDDQDPSEQNEDRKKATG